MGAWTLFTAFIARLGTADAAAHAIAMRVTSLSYMAGYGLCVARDDPRRAVPGSTQPCRRTAQYGVCLVLVIGLMGSLGLGFFIGRYPLVRLFTHDEAVIALGVVCSSAWPCCRSLMASI